MSWLAEALAGIADSTTDPTPMVPEPALPNFYKAPEYPHGRPWVIDEATFVKWEAAGFPDDLSGLA